MTENPDAPVRLRADVLAVPAYRQGAAPTKPGYKLSSNENPFDPLPSVLRALQGRSDINRYAAAAMPELREAIATEFDVAPDHVHLGAGSVAILYQLVQAAAGPGENYVYAWPSFEAYPSLGLASGASGVAVPLTASAEHDLEAMADAITERTRAVLICTPNNPTGPAVAADAFERFMERVPDTTLVILDEAYREFVTDAGAVRGEEVVARRPNVVLLRTFSKAYGLAGLRIGYAIGHPAILSAAQITAIPLSVTGVADTAARASLLPEARAEHEARIAEIVTRRDELAAGLRRLGIAVPEAQGNFVWVPQSDTASGGAGSGASGGVDAQALAAAFSESGTLVRPFPGDGVRISVGEHESVAEVLRVVEAYLSASR